MATSYDEVLERTILKGDTWDGINFVITRSVDYTGSSIKANFKRAYDGFVLLSKTITPNSASNGSIDFDVTLTAAETNMLSGEVITDIQITRGSEIKTPVKIVLTIELDITA